MMEFDLKTYEEELGKIKNLEEVEIEALREVIKKDIVIELFGLGIPVGSTTTNEDTTIRLSDEKY